MLTLSTIFFLVVVLSQCASQKTSSNNDVEVQKRVPEYVLQKSGAQLWAESCGRCHNTASPSTFGDVDWDVAMKHMEIRAQLTRIEAEKIREFMQSAN